jgi:hypothetical protein
MVNGQMLVAQACNSSYLGGRDKEDCSLKPAQEKPYLKKSHHKKRDDELTLGVVGPQFKPTKKEKKKKKKIWSMNESNYTLGRGQ